METLIIILIVVMIAQTCVFIYGNFFDISRNRESSANMEVVKGAQANFLDEKAAFKKNLDAKDHVIEKWIERANKLEFELDELRKVNGLLKNRTAYIEGLKDSFNQQAEYLWEKDALAGEVDDRTQVRCFVEGMKAGAEWICGAVGVDVRFEIDGRFDAETFKPKTPVGRCDDPSDGRSTTGKRKPRKNGKGDQKKV